MINHIIVRSNPSQRDSVMLLAAGVLHAAPAITWKPTGTSRLEATWSATRHGTARWNLLFYMSKI